MLGRANCLAELKFDIYRLPSETYFQSEVRLTIRLSSRNIQELFSHKSVLFLYENYIVKDLRINRGIRSPTVRLIGAEGEQLGIVAFDKALEMARELEMDLAEVAPNANPPVCKILDYGKYQYHQKKVDTKHKKMQKKAEIKGVRLGFKTGDHDIEVKAKQAKGFLEDGNSVKVTLIFRGRESMYKDLGVDKLRKFYESLKDVANVDMAPKSQGNMLIMILTPNKQ